MAGSAPSCHGYIWKWCAVDLETFASREMLGDDDEHGPPLRKRRKKGAKKKGAAEPDTTVDEKKALYEEIARVAVHPTVQGSIVEESLWAVMGDSAHRIEAYRVMASLSAKLTAPSTSLLYQLAQKSVLSALLQLGVKMPNAMVLYETQSTRLRAGEEAGVAFEKKVVTDTTYESEVIDVMKAVLKCAGFKETDAGWVPLHEDAVRRLIGPEAMRAGNNPLERVVCFKTANLAYNNIATLDPNVSSDLQMCAAVEEELGEEAFGSGKLVKPAWLLRRKIASKIGSGTIPDARVRAVSFVDVSKPFVVKFESKPIRSMRSTIGTARRIAITFHWQGRYRTTPGKALMKVMGRSML